VRFAISRETLQEETSRFRSETMAGLRGGSRKIQNSKKAKA
jgi:hypothetical protein